VCVFAVDDWQGLRTIDKNWWEEETPADERTSSMSAFALTSRTLVLKGKL
jgi:hypothetical protein